MAADNMIIFHNPRCSKSREALQYLEEQQFDIEIIDYLNTITAEKLREVIEMLGIKPEELLRKKESLFIENYKGKTFSDGEWIKIMAENPKLIERPIIIKDNKAIIGRPIERVVELVK